MFRDYDVGFRGRRRRPGARIVAYVVLAITGVSCRAATDRVVSESDAAPLPMPVLVASPKGVAIALTREGADIVGRLPGDQRERLRVRSATQPHTVARLCGVVAGEVRSPVRLDGAYGANGASGAAGDRPQLATRILRTSDLVGVRFLEPGESARYRFEGLTRGDRRHVSFAWPIASDPDRPIPAGAPDSVLEGAVMPTAAVLDSVVASLRWPSAPPTPRMAATDTQGALADVPMPSEADAVPLVSDLPVHQVSLESPCMDGTFAIPILARIDEVVRVPVRAGDRVIASAQVIDGTIRISFDEAPPTGNEPRQRQSIPRAAIQATVDGRVTVRVRAQVVPRAQATGQLVFLRLRRIPG